MLYAEATAYYQAKEYTKAAPLMSEASELGNPQAMAVLGTMYLFGHGVSENGPAALRCFASRAGNVCAKAVIRKVRAVSDPPAIRVSPVLFLSSSNNLDALAGVVHRLG
mgnify:CR=1 FL=1